MITSDERHSLNTIQISEKLKGHILDEMGFIDFGAEIREIKNHNFGIFKAISNLRLV